MHRGTRQVAWSALALLAWAGCGDDTTGSVGAGGSGGSTSSNTVGVSSGGNPTTTGGVTVTTSTGASSDGGGGNATTSDGGGGHATTSDGGGTTTSDGGGGNDTTSDGGGGNNSDGGGGQTSDGGGGQGGNPGAGGEGGAGGIPDSWFCNPIWYQAADGCDCECGAYDPDCDDGDQRIYRCGDNHLPGDGRACLATGICEPPEDWSCDDAEYGDGTTCNCTCGGADYDCLDIDNPIDGCDPGQSCDDEGLCSDVPVAWTCDDDEYGDGLTCNCECGVYDPDCDTSILIDGCDLLGQTCDIDGTCTAPTAWTCGDATWDDGTTCNCDCGESDPDCDEDLPIAGCDVGQTCVEGECITPAANDTCATAIALTEGIVTGTWVNASDDSNPGDDGCTNYDELGADVFYSVSLTTGQTLTVALAGTAADASLYLLSDCADAEGACVAGIDALASNGAETLTYTATANEDLTLVVDQYGATDYVDFQLTVDITP